MTTLTVEPRAESATAFSSCLEAPAAAQVQVLVVDDEPRNLLAMEALLAELCHKVIAAHSGQEALRRLLENDFAVILMDVRMPEMDGFETAALIRQRQRSQHTPIIFLTAFDRDDLQMSRGYSLGAVDYLHKPIMPEILRAKVNAFVDIFQKSQELQRQSALVRQLERREHERRLAEMKRELEEARLRAEIRVARQIHDKLFPAGPAPLPGFDIGGASFPAEATGGDYFDYIPMQDGALAIVVADVSGHGYGPALLMAETRAYLRAFILTQRHIPDILRLLNRALADDDLDDRFATLMLVRLDPERRALTYVSAGHPPGYVLDSTGAHKLSLPSTHLPLGVLPDASYEAGAEVMLGPGEGLLLFTDGITEARSADTEQLFGSRHMLDVVRAHWQRPAAEIVARLREAVRQFRGDAEQSDDMTAVLIKVCQQPYPCRPPRFAPE